MVDLGTLGGDGSWARAVNNKGVTVLESAVSAIAGIARRSTSKRPTISATKCCASAALPPLANASTLRGRDGATDRGGVGGDAVNPTISEPLIARKPSPRKWREQQLDHRTAFPVLTWRGACGASRP
jgi:hypothetical protein